MTMEEFLKGRHGVGSENSTEIKFLAVKVLGRPDDDRRDPGRTHWQCKLSRGNRRMVFHWSQGSAHKHAPKLADVLDNLASDASGVENAKSFEDWASEYGYDTDSRKAEKTYNACVKQSRDLRTVLGEDDYKLLLWEVERL